ncbi:TonB-dependent receptor plug domain-containing protein [Flavihumibacter solisilvae]|uniref:TonB-dependent receptor plug domain-containing protein n=1 Tax=Flavihumibacter solisilvae TaxID=1349421 RepID=UPI00068B5B4E|nr:TonB-dependent receptor plug domain-containing protein [Flavihumibacter solisilvae]
MKSIRILIICLLFSFNNIAQVTSLDSVIVQGYLQSVPYRNASSAVGLVRQADWERYSPAVMLPSLNTIPGVRMEERSPGSYRLAIRGSSLRSPFGVRNVRLYYNQLPFTDPGGNTYLNLFSPLAFNTLEIQKGPAGSAYGAGTGGVLIGSSDTAAQDLLNIRFLHGSYGLNQFDAAADLSSTAMDNRIQFSNQHSDGYRDHTSMRRTYGSWTGKIKQGEKASLSILALYSDLWYQTPGALTLSQYKDNPRQARPAAGMFPSAETANAAIRQKTFYSGIHEQINATDNLKFDFAVYGAWTGVTNPTIRNYEKRTEPHYGGRFSTSYRRDIGKSVMILTGGGEYQQGHFKTEVFKNAGGQPDSLQTADAITPQNALVFAQVKFMLPGGWVPSAGLSWNRNSVEIRRETVVPNTIFETRYNGEWAPRFALSKQFGAVTVYGVVAKGFSPPTTSELLPSTSIINSGLQAEWGWNYELGARGRILNQKLWYDLNVYYFRLNDAIVQRRDGSGADYFENAGSTKQFGFESYITYNLLSYPDRPWGIQAWLSYALQQYTYDEFVQLQTEFSGNRIPGVAKQVFQAGIDVKGPWNSYIHGSYQYTDPIWLNDGNTEKADAFHLVAARIGSQLFRNFSWFAGADNLLNVTYSLGNDINAAGGRYYNAAAKRNYYVGLGFHLKKDLPSQRARFR